MTTPAVLGERVLRRLGVEIVPVASRPALSATISVTSIAEQALQALGVPVAAADRPSASTVVSVTALAERALQAVGVTVTEADRPALTAHVTMQAIADAALQAVGVTVPAALQPPITTTVSATDLGTNVLIELGVIASDETPPTSDLALVVDKVGEVHAALVAQGLATWDAGAVPIGVSEEYIKLTALLSASSFGKTGDPALWAPLEKRVRTYSQVKQSQGAEILAKVASVHDSLVADGVASWASTAIPQAAFDEYVQLTWAQIAPVFGVTVDPATLPPIAARVKRISLLMQAQDLAEDRVKTVHDELVGNGYASWAVTAIPQGVADDYVALVQFQVANAFDMHTDVANLVPSLEARVKRYALVLQAQSLAEASVAALHDELVGSAFVSWALNAIPQAVSDDYAGLTMIRLAQLFDAKVDPAGVPAMEARIRHFSLVQRAPDLATEAVTAVHADLAARGKVRWTSLDIPLAAELPYVLLAAFKLAPEFAVQPNPNDYTLAEKSIARLIALPTSGERVRAQYF
jgi:hypothetical protein